MEFTTMKLEMLREAVTTASIAAGPMIPFGEVPRKKKRKRSHDSMGRLRISEDEKAGVASGYLSISKRKQPINKMTTVWTAFKSPKGSSWEQQYAAKNDPDTRLLKQYRGKGY